MYDDAAEGMAASPRGTRGRYPIEARKYYVNLFLASQPISQREFARKHGFNRKSLMKWLRVYAGVSPNENMNRHSRKTAPGAGRKPVPKSSRTPEQKPAARPAPPSGALKDDTCRTITIPYMEYMELLALKAKLNAVRAVCQ